MYYITSNLAPLANVVQAPRSFKTDIEAQHLQEVFVLKKQRSATYTEALRDPSILESAPDFLANRKRYDISFQSASHTCSKPFPVLLIIKEVNRVKVLIAMLALSVLSVGIGCAVGIATHHTDLGIDVASGLFGLLAVLLGLCAWGGH